jgi:cytochrome c556
MRLRHTFAVPLLAALLAAGCGGGSQAPAGDGGGATGGVAFQPVASVGQVMDAIVIPRSEQIFEGAIYDNGELVTAPDTLEEWAELEFAALALAEAGNLLLIPPRLRDEDEWVTRAHAMTDAALEVLQAARAQDVDELLATGGLLYASCVTCHETYIPPDVP